MSEEEKAELEDERAKVEKRNVAKQLATSFPKFVLNGLIAIALGLFYFFIVPLFQPILNSFPILVLYTIIPAGVIVLTGYSIMAIGVLLVILLFGIEAIMQFAKSADAFAEFVISRLPGMRSSDSKHPRRIPLDLIYIFFILVVYVIISPIFLPGNFPIPLLEPYFQIIAVAFVLFFVLVFVYDLAKSIQKSAKRGIDRFGARLGRRYEDQDEPERAETDY